MTIWTPDLSAREGPKYRALAEAIAEAIGTGELSQGARLPTHRELAWRLGVTVGTVSRAYALVQMQGLTTGEVGRGTYVAPAGVDGSAPATRFSFPLTAFDRPASARDSADAPITMNQNFPAAPWVNGLLAEAMRQLADPARLGTIEGYPPSNGLRHHRQAAKQWLKQFGIDRDEDSIVIVGGCQHGLAVSFMTLCSRGDTILTEALTWPGAKQLAEMLELNVVPVDVDGEGILPDAFEAACREYGARLLYCVPTLHNPTTAVLPEARRRAIAETAERYDVYVVEDDVFGYVETDAPAPIATLAPERGIYVTSLSKPVSPLLRAGFLTAPPALIPDLAAGVRVTSLMPSPLNAELAADLIMSGAAEAAAERQRDESATRQNLASEILGDAPRRFHPCGTHIWLELPPAWNDTAFTAQCRARGVLVTPGSAFVVKKDDIAGQTVRICLNAERDRERIREGLGIVADLLKSAPPAAEQIV